MTKPLEQVIADAREEAAVLRRQGHGAQSDAISHLCDEVRESALEYLTWLTDDEAALRSGRSTDWLRGRFPDWQEQGNAKLDGRRRLYRMIVVPRRARTEAAHRRGVDRGRAA